MAEGNGLMHPLRSEHLKPRPSTQAVWEPCAPAHKPPMPDFLPESPAEPAAETQAPRAPIAESVFTFAPACNAQPEPPAQEPEPEAALPDAAEPEKEEESFDLDSVIEAVLSPNDEDDEDEESSLQDALPTDEMPEPVTVPLYEISQPKPARRGWIGLISAALLTAAAGYAAQVMGWLN